MDKIFPSRGAFAADGSPESGPTAEGLSFNTMWVERKLSCVLSKWWTERSNGVFTPILQRLTPLYARVASQQRENLSNTHYAGSGFDNAGYHGEENSIMCERLHVTCGGTFRVLSRSAPSV